MKKLLLFFGLGLVLLPSAYADTLTFTLLNPSQTGMIGSTLTYTAKVTASSSNATSIYLNEDSFTLSGLAVLDDAGFFNNFPLSLNPGETYTGVLFTLALPSSPPIASSGTFSLLGGPNASAISVLGTQKFSADAAAVTPEPSTWLLLLSASLVGIRLVSRRRSTTLRQMAT